MPALVAARARSHTHAHARACPSQEDCKYCAQSTRHKTKVKATPMMQVDEVLEAARRAKLAGSTRFCMGTAWRELGAKKTAFKRILGMVSDIKKLDLEVCCTLGMLSKEQVGCS